MKLTDLSGDLLLPPMLAASKTEAEKLVGLGIALAVILTLVLVAGFLVRSWVDSREGALKRLDRQAGFRYVQTLETRDGARPAEIIDGAGLPLIVEHVGPYAQRRTATGTTMVGAMRWHHVDTVRESSDGDREEAVYYYEEDHLSTMVVAHRLADETRSLPNLVCRLRLPRYHSPRQVKDFMVATHAEFSLVYKVDTFDKEAARAVLSREVCDLMLQDPPMELRLVGNMVMLYRPDRGMSSQLMVATAARAEAIAAQLQAQLAEPA